ncbi:phosphatase PAP2 family protein [Streptomyces sp. NPDC046727]|uniref:phosphatase PAP2 family protein n=1 Tax=Streptomyces sp. NPDC046727 TaxID=3155373 RepID=UPI0033FA5C23
MQAGGRPAPAAEGVVSPRRGRRRPDSSSFPSGHTAAAVAFTTAVAPTWPAAGALCAVLAAMVALERVQSGAHYPSDVAVGAAIGLASAWLHPPRSAPDPAPLALAGWERAGETGESRQTAGHTSVLNSPARGTRALIGWSDA